jgi:uncharacterized membrane protein YdjX (TVP38/TMEM64 family)
MIARVAVAAGLVVVVLVVARQVPLADIIGTLRAWAQSGGTIGMVGFGAAYVVLALLFVPGAVLTLAAGAVFGIGWGVVIVAIATSVADAAAFVLGRYVARDAVVRLISRRPRLQVIDRTITLGGWRIVALIRLNPTIPYSASNYLFGATGLAIVPFLIASGIFTMPGAFAYVYLGYMGAETLGGSDRTAVEWVLLGLGLAVTIAGVVYVGVLARRALAEIDRT